MEELSGHATSLGQGCRRMKRLAGGDLIFPILGVNSENWMQTGLWNTQNYTRPVANTQYMADSVFIWELCQGPELWGLKADWMPSFRLLKSQPQKSQARPSVPLTGQIRSCRDKMTGRAEEGIFQLEPMPWKPGSVLSSQIQWGTQAACSWEAPPDTWRSHCACGPEPNTSHSWSHFIHTPVQATFHRF